MGVRQFYEQNCIAEGDNPVIFVGKPNHFDEMIRRTASGCPYDCSVRQIPICNAGTVRTKQGVALKKWVYCFCSTPKKYPMIGTFSA